MENHETGKFVRIGTASLAPVYVSVTGEQPVWSGRLVFELSRSDIGSIEDFCMEVAWNAGYEDGESQRPMLPNPFHERFLQGDPHTVFKDYYMRGRSAAERGRIVLKPRRANMSRGVAEAR